MWQKTAKDGPEVCENLNNLSIATKRVLRYNKQIYGKASEVVLTVKAREENDGRVAELSRP